MVYLHLSTLLVVITYVSSNVAKNQGTFELLILHNNDMHARFEQTSQLSGACTTADRDAGKCYGGFPRVAYLVKQARAAANNGSGPPVLYLNAGDTYTGTPWFTIYKWKIAAEFVNALKPDAVSLGNHEFDNGVSGLTPFIENLSCPVLAANILLDNEPGLQRQTNLMNSTVITIKGTKIGIIGYLTPETKVLAAKNKVEYVDEVIALEEEAERLKSLGINIIIALGHSGHAKDLEIARNVHHIDLVIGGHTNTFLYNGEKPDSEIPDGLYPVIVKQKTGRKVPVVQAYAYTKYLGKFHLTFDSAGEIVSFEGNPLLLDQSVPQDPEVLTILDEYRYQVDNISNVVIGSTLVNLEALRCKTKECNLGNMLADAMVYKYALEYEGEGWTDAPIAVLQRGGIRAPIIPFNLPANITYGDILSVVPFDNQLLRISISGYDIWKMLEHSVARYQPMKAPGEFLQMSGMKVVYDMKKRPFMRVTKVYLLCGMCKVPEYKPINKSQEYGILITDFLFNGGDGYSMFNSLPAEYLGYTDSDATTEYVTAHSPLHPAIEDRITIYNFDKMRKSSANVISAPLLLISFFTALSFKLF